MSRSGFRFRLVASVVAVMALGATAAFAVQSFEDVPNGVFYEDATAWAKDEGLTVGCNSPGGGVPGTLFCPGAAVTRAQNITFTYRHQTLVIDPLLDDIRADVASVDEESPDRVVWVADDGSGQFSSLSAALASITDASASNPYVVRIAPGTYTETSPVVLKSHVDVEGSGARFTTITCSCGGSSKDGASATVSADDVVTELRHVAIENTGTGDYSLGVYTTGGAAGAVSMLHVGVSAAGGIFTFGVYNDASSPSMTHVTVTASGSGSGVHGVYNDASSPSMIHVAASATGSDFSSSFGVTNSASSPSMVDVIATAAGDEFNAAISNFSSLVSMEGVTATAESADNGGWGVWNDSSLSIIRNSSIAGVDGSISNSATAPAARVADTLLDGAVSGSGFACSGAYTELFAPLNPNCVP